MEIFVQSLIQEERARFVESVPWSFSYGTAGFRDKAERLDRIVFRVGVLASLRSKVVGGMRSLQNDYVCTYSHLPCSYHWSGHYRFTQPCPSTFNGLFHVISKYPIEEQIMKFEKRGLKRLTKMFKKPPSGCNDLSSVGGVCLYSGLKLLHQYQVLFNNCRIMELK